MVGGLKVRKFGIMFVASTIVLLGSCELVLRLIGLGDFPLYDADPTIGYIVRANQSGDFLHKNEWQFNAHHMGTRALEMSQATDTLLIGDSVVLGGNPISQPERLGPQLESISASPVWPISADSWSLANELIYIEQNADVVRAMDEIVFILNSEDFRHASTWECSVYHPLKRPQLLTIHVIQKYLYNWIDCQSHAMELSIHRVNWRTKFHELILRGILDVNKITVFLYPDLKQTKSRKTLSTELEFYRDELAGLGINRIVSVARSEQWNSDLYRDSIHPTAHGNHILAQIIFQALNP